MLHVAPTYLPAVRYGGPIYVVHGLSRALAERGHDVHVFTTNVDGPGVSPVPFDRPDALDGVILNYFPTGLGRRLYRSPAMARALKERAKSFDIVHLHSVFLWPTLAAANAAGACGVPYIVTPHGMLVRDLIARKSRLLKSAWIALFERRNLERAAAVHFTSQVEADEMRRLGLTCRRSAVIPNGLDLAEAACAAAAVEETWLGTLPQPYILYLGRLNWKKGLDRLVTAMVHVDTAGLVIAGNDEEGYQRTLAALADKLGAAQKIKFIGPVSGARKWALLRRARLLVLPSHSENFGMVVLEAMAAGCPVIVTPEVGLADVVKTSGAGLVVDGSPARIAEAINSLAKDTSRREKMGDAGRKTAADRFSWTRVASDMADLYASCL